MSTRLLASGSLVLLLAACATPTATSEGKAPGPSQVSPPAPPAVEDRSLGLAQYVELGIPSAEGSWDGEDYVLAAQALAAIAQKNPAELPRYRSTRSGPLFARLTAFENVDAIEKLEVAPLARVQLAGSVMEPVSQILMLYIGANATSGSFATEMIELQSFISHAAAEMMEAIDRVPLTGIRNREAFESGMAQIRTGLGSVVIGALTTLSERKVYSDEDRLRFLGTLKQDLPRLVPQLASTTQKEVPARLETLLADEPSPEVKRELEALRSALAAPAP